MCEWHLAAVVPLPVFSLCFYSFYLIDYLGIRECFAFDLTVPVHSLWQNTFLFGHSPNKCDGWVGHGQHKPCA